MFLCVGLLKQMFHAGSMMVGTCGMSMTLGHAYMMLCALLCGLVHMMLYVSLCGIVHANVSCWFLDGWEMLAENLSGIWPRGQQSNNLIL